MDTLLLYLPALACVGVMLVVCVPMMKNMHKDHGESEDTAIREEVTELRGEVARLKAERALEEKEPING
jgi:hypothetical protein